MLYKQNVCYTEKKFFTTKVFVLQTNTMFSNKELLYKPSVLNCFSNEVSALQANCLFYEQIICFTNNETFCE